MRQLSNCQHYETSTVKLFDQSNKKIKSYLSNCVTNGLIPTSTHLQLTTKSPRLPTLYLLPKIHKANNPGRPIISACGGPTEKISSFVDHILKPLVVALLSHVKDTTHFIDLLATLDIPDNHILMTIDVSSLYTNIPHDEGIEACRKYLTTRTTEEPPTWLVVNLLRYILTLNYFEFNGRIYHQVSHVCLIVTFDPNHQQISTGVNQSLFLLENVKPKFTNQRVMVTFRRNKNLKDHLVHSALTTDKTPLHCLPCGKPRCTTCPHVDSLRTVTSTSTNRTLRVTMSSDCLTQDVVYLITCRKYKKQYIGQTSNRYTSDSSSISVTSDKTTSSKSSPNTTTLPTMSTCVVIVTVITNSFYTSTGCQPNPLHLNHA